VANVTIPGATYRDVHAACRTTVDLGIKVGAELPVLKNFISIARAHLAK
jgi:hypothetical protein